MRSGSRSIKIRYAYRKISNDASGDVRHMRGLKYDITEGKGTIAAKIITCKDKEETVESISQKTIHSWFGWAKPLAAEPRPAVRRTGIASPVNGT